MEVALPNLFLGSATGNQSGDKRSLPVTYFPTASPHPLLAPPMFVHASPVRFSTFVSHICHVLFNTQTPIESPVCGVFMYAGVCVWGGEGEGVRHAIQLPRLRLWSGKAQLCSFISRSHMTLSSGGFEPEATGFNPSPALTSYPGLNSSPALTSLNPFPPR